MIASGTLMALAIVALTGTAYSEDPCESIICILGDVCVSTVEACKNPPCPRIGRCVSESPLPIICKPVQCMKPCKKGKLRKFDKNGCETCACYIPCSGTIDISHQQECAALVSPNGVNRVAIDKLVCWAHGDPHYHTFDGNVIHYQGLNSYIMSQRTASCDHLVDFQLIVKHETRKGVKTVSYVKYITLYLLPSTEIKIEKLHIIRVNGAFFTNGDTLPDRIISMDTVSGLVETDFGVSIQFNGDSTAFIWIPQSYSSCVEGICGNANGNVEDDLENREGQNCGAQSPSRKYWCVGNSWIYGAPTKTDRTEDPVRSPCRLARYDNNNYCAALKRKDGLFGACIDKMSVVAANAYDSCIFDVCANKKLAKDLACNSLEMFAGMCGDLVNDADWRQQTGCLCPGDLEWTVCGRKNCNRTCANPNVSCGFECFARCQCPRASPFQEGNSCFSKKQCRKSRLWPSRK